MKKKLKLKRINTIYNLGIIMILALVPLIVFGHNDILTKTEIKFWKGEPAEFNFFTFWKAKTFIILSFLSAFMFIAGLITKNISLKKSRLYIPLGIYGFFIIFSSIFSGGFPLTLKGFVDQYQGMWVLLGYVIIMIVAYHVSYNEKAVRYIVYALSFSTFIVTLAGAFQYAGYYYLNNDFIKLMVLPSSYHHLASQMEYKGQAGAISSTLFHSNYMGSFTALLLPVFILMSIYVVKNSKYSILKAATILITALSAINWVGSLSRAGYFGLISGTVFMTFIMRRKIKRKYIFRMLAVAGVGLIIIMGVLNFTGLNVNSDFSGMNILREIENINKKNEELVFKDILTGKYYAEIITNKETLKIQVNKNNIEYYDGKGNVLSAVEKNGEIYFEDEKYLGYIITEEITKGRITANVYGRIIYFYIREEGIKILSIGNKLVENYVPETAGFENLENFASARVYIWTRTIPLLKRTLLKGYGADTFTYVFPQNDIVGKLNNYQMSRIVVDKPHNMFLQIAVSSGIPALISVLTVFIMFLAGSIKELNKAKIISFSQYLLLGITTGVMCYLFAGVFNDESVTVAPIFWILLGLGAGISKQIKNEGKETKVKTKI